MRWIEEPAYPRRPGHHRVHGRGLRLFVLLFAIVSGVVLLLRG